MSSFDLSRFRRAASIVADTSRNDSNLLAFSVQNCLLVSCHPDSVTRETSTSEVSHRDSVDFIN
jgi:hypothetical protein